ncbi:MAG: hypothetical protein P8O79_15010, partial [Halieaceae bacterium]|nr:hypothetical protein [Halieaceae bacterium]
VRFGSVRFGSVRFGSVRFGSVRFGSVRFGSVKLISNIGASVDKIDVEAAKNNVAFLFVTPQSSLLILRI